MKGHGVSKREVVDRRDGILTSPGLTELQYFKSKNETPESRQEGEVSRSSRMSLKSGGASVRRAKAELGKQRCLKMQEIERQQEAIEQQLQLVQIKQEMEAKQAELQRKRELIKLDNEIEQAKLDEEAERSMIDYPTSELEDYAVTLDRSVGSQRGLPNKNSPKGFKSSRVDAEEISFHNLSLQKGKESQSVKIPAIGTRQTQNTQIEQNVIQSKEHLPESSHMATNLLKRSTTDESDPLCRVLQSQQESLILMANTLGSSIRKGFEMPKWDCLGFNGNPMNYPRFIENFKTNIEEREPEPRVRLAYLIQFCTGVVKDAISNCVMLPNEEGFLRAKEILHNSFGQSHIITHAYIERVTKGGVIRDGESEKLLQLARDMENCQINLTQLGCESEINAQSNLERIVGRLPRYMQAEWAKEAFTLTERGKVPTFKNLTSFVTMKARLASSAFGQLIGARPQEDKYSKLKGRKPQGTSFATEGGLNNLKCYCKKTGHLLERCFSFRKETLDTRKDVICGEKVCNLCLGKGHFVKQCRRKEICMVAGCGQRHHSLLHPAQQPKNQKESLEVKEQTEKNNEQLNGDTGNGHCSATGAGRPGVRLRVVPVTVRGVDEIHEVQTYALLDDGSDVSLCTSSLVKRLGISGVPTTFSLTTVNERAKENRGEEVRLIVSDLHGSENVDVTRAWTVNNLPISKKSIPMAHDVHGWPHLDGIVFPELENEDVSIIIGSDVPEVHWVLQQRRGGPKEPYAVKTPLGWTLMEPTATEAAREFQTNFIRREDDNLQKQVEKMFRMDFSETDCHLGKGMSLEDKRALNIMESSVKQVDGHYEIALLWRDGSPNFPNNRKMAERRLISLQHRLKNDPSLKERYRNVIEDYLEKGYAAKVPEGRRMCEDENTTGRIWYLPHHPVFNARKPDKVCVVFDCAAKFGDTSLNDQLLQGLDLSGTGCFNLGC